MRIVWTAQLRSSLVSSGLRSGEPPPVPEDGRQLHCSFPSDTRSCLDQEGCYMGQARVFGILAAGRMWGLISPINFYGRRYVSRTTSRVPLSSTAIAIKRSGLPDLVPTSISFPIAGV